MYQINGQVIQLSFKMVEVKNDYIMPTIALIFSRSSKAAQNVESKDLIIKNPIASFP